MALAQKSNKIYYWHRGQHMHVTRTLREMTAGNCSCGRLLLPALVDFCARAMVCHRIIGHESIISPTAYFPPLPSSQSRTYHPHLVKVQFACTATYQSSFFVSAIRLWNCLALDVVSLSSSLSFNRALENL